MMVTMNDVFTISIYLTDKPKKGNIDERKYYFFSTKMPRLNKITLERAVSNITDMLMFSPTAKNLLKEGNYRNFIQDEKHGDQQMTISQIGNMEVHSRVLFFTYAIFLSYFRFFGYRKSDNYTPILLHFKKLKFCAENSSLRINEKVSEIVLSDEEEALERYFFNRIQVTFEKLKDGSVSDMLYSIQDTYDEYYQDQIQINDEGIDLELVKFANMDGGETSFEEDPYGKIINLRNSLTEEDFDNIKRIIDDICTPKLAATYVKGLKKVLERYNVLDVWDEESIKAAKRDRSKSNVRQLEEAVRIRRLYPWEFDNIDRQQGSQLDN
jgi:hypothetical protein